MRMYQAADFTTPPATVIAGPLAPSEYVRLRRRAAGLSPEQLADALARIGHNRAQALQIVDLLERPGAVTRHMAVLDALDRVMPFDQQVYRQLANEAPERHPSVCRGCGCSKFDPCEHHGVLRPCELLTQDLCSRCAGDAA